MDRGSLAANQGSQQQDSRWRLLDDRALWFGYVPATFKDRPPLSKRYIVRATRSGDFQWPGPHIEAMYDERRHGIGLSSRLEIRSQE